MNTVFLWRRKTESMPSRIPPWRPTRTTVWEPLR